MINRQIMSVIFKLYPEVTIIRDDIAYDANENVVEYDMAAVQSYIDANAYKELRAKEYPPMAEQ